MVAAGHAGLVAEPLVDVQGALVLAGGLVIVPAVLGEDAELVVAGGHAGLVAEPLSDVQGALVLAGRLVVVPAVLGEHAELVVAGGHAGLVAEPLFDVQGALVLAGGLVVVPAVLGEDAEMVVAGGHAGLVAEPFADVQGALVLAGGLVVVPAAWAMMPSWWIQTAWRGESAGSRARVSWISAASWSHAPQVCSWLQTGPVTWAAASVSPACSRWWRASSRSCTSAARSCGQIRYPPPPVGGRLPVRPGQPRAGLAAGGQLGRGPPVHEEPLILPSR